MNEKREMNLYLLLGGEKKPLRLLFVLCLSRVIITAKNAFIMIVAVDCFVRRRLRGFKENEISKQDTAIETGKRVTSERPEEVLGQSRIQGRVRGFDTGRN